MFVEGAETVSNVAANLVEETETDSVAIFLFFVRRGALAQRGLSWRLQRVPSLVAQGLRHKRQCGIGVLLPPHCEYEGAL